MRAEVELSLTQISRFVDHMPYYRQDAASTRSYNREIVSYEIAERPLPFMIESMLTKAFE